MICIHCQTRIACRPRGLCTRCYYVPGLRERYPFTGDPKYIPHYLTHIGAGDFCGEAPLPTPTTTLPNTEAKVAVLAERARMHQSLWHPLDATLEDI